MESAPNRGESEEIPRIWPASMTELWAQAQIGPNDRFQKIDDDGAMGFDVRLGGHVGQAGILNAEIAQVHQFFEA